MIRNVARRLCRLESRFMTTSDPGTFRARILLVDPQKGLTGVMVFEGDNPMTIDAGTAAEVERVRADLGRRRSVWLATEARIDTLNNVQA